MQREGEHAGGGGEQAAEGDALEHDARAVKLTRRFCRKITTSKPSR